jgi:hypothetical protein
MVLFMKHQISKLLSSVLVTIGALLALSDASAATLRMAPPSHDFGTLAVGQSVSVNVFLDAQSGLDTLRTLDMNAGSGALVSGDYTLNRGSCNPQGGSSTGTLLSAGGGCTFSVTFSPSSTGTRTATASASDYTAGAWVHMNLTGAGSGVAVVPTLSEWALITFAMFIVGMGVYQQRRRQL